MPGEGYALIFLMKQKDVVNQIQYFLNQRGIKLEPGFLDVGEQPCLVFEKDNKYIAIDPGGGIWTGSEGDWSLVSPTYSVADALIAVDFLA